MVWLGEQRGEVNFWAEKRDACGIDTTMPDYYDGTARMRRHNLTKAAKETCRYHAQILAIGECNLSLTRIPCRADAVIERPVLRSRGALQRADVDLSQFFA